MTMELPPRFSILIPLHNKAAYIGCTLASVFAQTFRDFEVIVVDDGSTDGSEEVVAALRDPRLRLVCQANAGVSVTRNRAIELARGEWVAFLDADDWQHPDYLACLAGIQAAQPQADMVATRFVEFEDTGGAPPPWQVPVQRPVVELITDLPGRWMRGPSLFTSSIAVRRSRLRAMQPCFAPGESWGEDLDLWFRLAEQTPIALAHVPLVAYRKGVGGSLGSAEAAPRTLPPWVDRLAQRARSGRLPPQLADSTFALIANFRLDMARRALAGGRRAEALLWLARAPGAITAQRWWTTAAMALMPQPLARASLRRIEARTRAAGAPAPAPAPAWGPARTAEEAIELLLQPGQPAPIK